MASQSQILRKQAWRSGFEQGHNEGWKSGMKFGVLLGALPLVLLVAGWLVFR